VKKHLLVNENKVDTGMNKLGAIVGSLSKVGVNATILPGSKIGKKHWSAREK
jgi:bifunctional UDP-N-acetylglucosamine pyrophosphorylase/glucosamine-1-phosphate N-acetyltransferase